MLAVDLLATLDLFLESVTPLRRRQQLALPIQRAQAKLGKAFATQRRLFLDRFEALRSHFQEAASADDGTVDSALAAFNLVALSMSLTFADLINELTNAAMQAGGDETIADLGVELSFDLANPRAVQYLAKYGAARVTQIDQTTRDQLQTILTNGVANGDSYDMIASQITEMFGQFSTTRAHLIAVTEAGNAYQEANMIVGRDLAAGGLEMEKSWLTAGDSHVDPDLCAPNEAQGWIPLDDTFQSGDDRPLAHPACRCAIMIRRVGAGD